MHRYFPYFLVCSLVLIIGCKKDNTPKGPFILVQDIKRYTIYQQYDYSSISSPTSDSCIVIALACLDQTLQVIKLDQNLNLVWEVNINEDFSRIGNIIESTDNEYLIISTPKGESIAGWPKLIKISKSGHVIWKKEYLKSASNVFYGSSINQIADGNFILTSAILWDSLMLIKVNSDGASIWSREYHVPDASFGFSKSYIDPFGLFIYTNGQKIIGFDSDGKILWQTPYYNLDVFTSLNYSTNSGFFVTGYNRYLQGKYYTNKILLAYYSDTGIRKWVNTYQIGSVSHGTSLCITNSEGIYILGTSTFQNNGYETLIIKTDQSGEELFNATIEGLTIPNSGVSIMKESTGFIVYGFEKPGNGNASQFYLTKFVEIN